MDLYLLGAHAIDDVRDHEWVAGWSMGSDFSKLNFAGHFLEFCVSLVLLMINGNREMDGICTYLVLILFTYPLEHTYTRFI